MKINLKLKNNLKNKHQKIVSTSFATFEISFNYVLYTRVKHSLLASLQETFVMWHLHVSGIFKSDQDSWQIVLVLLKMLCRCVRGSYHDLLVNFATVVARRR